jgi:F420-dependent oxidoreductase-like protein
MLRTQQFGWEGQLDIVRAAERLGYDTVWVPESFGFDAVSQIGAFAAITNRIRLATGIVNVYGRSPATLAETAATVDMMSGGRFQLGLGTSSSTLAEGWHGVTFEPAGTRLREAIEIIRLILARERLTYHGACFTFDAGIRLPEHPIRDKVPIYVGALTSAGLRLTAEIADGWIAAFVSSRHFETVFRPALDAGKRKRDPGLEPLRICVYLPVLVTGDVAVGRNVVRPRLAQYIGIMGKPERNYYAKLFSRYGFGEEVSRVQQLYAQRERPQAEATVTDDMIDLVSVIGPVSAVRERLMSLETLGIDEVALEVSIAEGGIDGFLETLSALAPQADHATIA